MWNGSHSAFFYFFTTLIKTRGADSIDGTRSDTRSDKNPTLPSLDARGAKAGGGAPRQRRGAIRPPSGRNEGTPRQRRGARQGGDPPYLCSTTAEKSKGAPQGCLSCPCFFRQGVPRRGGCRAEVTGGHCAKHAPPRRGAPPLRGCPSKSPGGAFAQGCSPA